MSEKQNIRITVDHRGNTLYRSQDNVFRTREEAEAKLAYNEAFGTIREYILEQNGDWMPGSKENKYYLCHDNQISPGEWFINWEYHDYSGAIGAYAKSSQIIKDTIEKYPKELEIIREYVINHNV